MAGTRYKTVSAPHSGELADFFNPKDDDAVIKASVVTVLMTTPGERFMDTADFGSGLLGMLWEPNTPGIATRIRSMVEDALSNWEPRVEVLEVDAVSNSDQPDTVHVTVRYRRIDISGGSEDTVSFGLSTTGEFRVF